MARAAGVPFRCTVMVGLAVAMCGLLAACGDASSPPPGTPTAATTPAPGPTPEPDSFLHLRHEGGDITTYQIDATTGRLQLAGTQRLGDVRALAGDPDGRYVYMAYGPPDRAASEHQDASIVLYEADPSGRLVGLSEASSRPWETFYSTDCWGAGWTWLSASRSRIWGLWNSSFASFCHHDFYTSVSHAVTTGGQLGMAVGGGFWEDFGAAALDAEADVLYKSRLGGDYSGTGAMTSHVVWPDGLKTMGTTSLCVASQVELVDPLVAVRGYVFGSTVTGVWPHLTTAVCSWEGPRLAPRGSLATSASVAAAFSPADDASPALLAMASNVYLTRHHTYQKTELRLLSTRDGNAALLDTVEFPSRVRQLLFHPSGRFLYAADEDGQLWTYSVGSGSRLEPSESVPDAAHSSNPYDPAPPPFMAVSVPSGAPRL